MCAEEGPQSCKKYFPYQYLVHQTKGSDINANSQFDLPERMIEVTEHRAAIHCCRNCGGETRAAFPEGLVSPAQYGERIKAAAIYLNVQQLIPEDRAALALSDLFGAPRICPASPSYSRGTGF